MAHVAMTMRIASAPANGATAVASTVNAALAKTSAATAYVSRVLAREYVILGHFIVGAFRLNWFRLDSFCSRGIRQMGPVVVTISTPAM